MKQLLRLHSLIICFSLTIANIQAQETFPRNDILDERMEAYAFVNATIVVDPETIIESGTMLVKDGMIESVGPNIKIPEYYVQIDLNGKYIYPSFIDMHTSYGIPQEEERGGRGRGGFGGAEQIQSATKGAYNSNEAIKSYYSAAREFNVDSKTSDSWRTAGFGTVLTFREDGIARGTSALVTLQVESPNEAMISSEVSAHYSFSPGSSGQNYPRSMMGYISLLRQTYLDADWFASHSPRPFADQALEAWIDQQDLPQIFDAGSWLDILRADKVGDEFGKQYIIKGGMDAYQRIREIKASGASLIVPMNFPEARDVEDPIEATKVSLEDMLHWELAPTNPGVLEANGITFSITSDGLNNKSDLLKNIRKSIEYGLSKAAALKALTLTPAKLLGVEDRLGTLKSGKIANFLITSGPLFEEKTFIHENWIQGKAYKYKDLEVKDFSGKYIVNIDDDIYNLEVSGSPGEHKAKIALNDSTHIDVNSNFSSDLVTLSFQPDKKGDAGAIRLSGWTSDSGWDGMGQLGDGTWIEWTASRSGNISKKETNPEKRRSEGKNETEDHKGNDPKNTDDKNMTGNVVFPFIAYGNEEIPTQQTMIIRNATVWTNEQEGILEETDVLLKDGKIDRIGKNLKDDNASIIDGTGKHLTSGIIDEHSHIAGGGNERASNSSMVRIGDQLNSEHINIYRALSGGVTALQVLHGSANPIGGQSALIKLRWGQSPEKLKIDGADGFIKFALGENVKRSSNESSIRYPQSRMGVEQVYVDAFTNALEYKKEWNKYNSLSLEEKKKKIKPRRDLVHETMLEIIRGERFITCHSYVQSEINMLMKVAEQFGFTVNTFTHILEGYKVADKMAEHGAGASTFSDWWNYKWEVRYAIPYNAAIMHREGVVTAINSDDANMGRRLNQEAAKAIKYGGVTEEEAWKMVTLNPAKLLHLDDIMGSIKVGKDADVVLWSDHPLSVYAKAEKTIVDGTIYFDIEEDAKKRDRLIKERNRLIQKMKDAKKSGSSMRQGRSAIQLEFHCEGFNHESEEH